MSNSTVRALPATKMDDDKRRILEKIGDLAHVEIAQNEVLLAIYIRPGKTAGGIALVSQTLKEDRYQGKCGLVVKIGEACNFDFSDPYTGVVFKLDIKLHDWVVVRTSDTWTLDVSGNPSPFDLNDFIACRLVRARDIRMRTDNPASIW